MRSGTTVEHRSLRPGTLEDRLYQARIARAAVEENTLVVLPTGLGKTAIALRVMAEFLGRRPDRSILLLAPTRPLAVQHARSAESTLVAPPPLVLTGEISPDRRARLLAPPQIVVATPQVIANDLRRRDFPLETFSLVIFDEAHRAVGDYPYVDLGREVQRLGLRILAMTASPGSRIDRIREVWANLGIRRFEHRGAYDADVLPYTHAVGVEPVSVPIPVEVRHLGIRLRTAVERQAETLRRLGFLTGFAVTRRELLDIGQLLQREIATARRRGGTPGGDIWRAMTAQAIAMKALHALDLIETQGVDALRLYFERQTGGNGGRVSPAVRGFLTDPDVRETRRLLESIAFEHPKIAKAVEVVGEELGRNPDARVILFAHYRQTAERLVEEFRRLGDARVRAVRFVGQATHGADEGMTQKEQVAILDRFRRGDVNVLVATSVAEEGLDIPATDLVVLYEPVPDEIRTIQRRGRTGRARAGRAVVLIAEGTRDIGMHRAAQAKERRMHEMLERVQDEARAGLPPPVPTPVTAQTTLSEFSGE
jgi:ERCC4-related helicase